MLGQMMTMPLTINSLVDHAARYHGDAEITSVDTDRSITRTTWREVAGRSRKLASALSNAGMNHGDRCATIAWNNYRHLEVYFGVSGSGLVCHTINPRLFPDQVKYIINHAADRIIFIDATFLPLIAGLKDEIPSVERIILMGPRDDTTLGQLPNLEFYEEFLETGDTNYTWPEFDENTASSLCYTSGTTGNPKGVLYSHRSTLLHSLAVSLPDSLNISAMETVLPVVPMFHVNAWGVPYASAMVGARMVMPGPGLDGDSLVKLIEDEKITLALGVPTIWQMLLNSADASGATLESLKRTVVGGSACPAAMIDKFRDQHGVETIHAWGMTETSPVGSVNKLLAKHLALPVKEQNALRTSQGRPPFGVELEIFDAESQPVEHDGVAYGDLHIRGHWVVSKYFGFDDSTTTKDGWFATGDVASIDADGYMTIRDRSKDIIKSGGEWISSVELEGIAQGISGLADAAVIGARHPKWDERPVLIAVKSDGDIDEKTVLEAYKGKIASWQIPDAVVFTDEIPRNPTGKVMKIVLREKFAGVLEERGA
ncbi:MAG: long-chain-fatty-acid--CoA ligase [Rhizobiaceae bacterium]